MDTTQTNGIPCGACNGAEFPGSGYSDADHCPACSNGLAVCYCGEVATAVECGDPVCADHRDGEGDEAVPAAICECCDEQPATTTETAVIWTRAFTDKPGSVATTPMCGPCAAAVVGQIRPWMATGADMLTGCVAQAWPAAPADPGRTKRIPVETMRQVVFGQEVA